MRRRGLFVLGTALLAVLVPGVGFGATPRDPHGIGCPAAPAGWTIKPGDYLGPGKEGGRTIVTPSSPGGLDEMTGLQVTVGGNQVSVACDYVRTDTGRRLQVNVIYALPSDPNPIFDHYFGCGSGQMKWDEDYRRYQVISPRQWAIAAFYDYLGSLKPGDVGAFETVTKQLLQNAEGYAHDCTLKTKETLLTFTFKYAFQSAAGSGKVDFETPAAMIATGALPVLSTTTPSYTMRVENHPVTVKVSHGVGFYPGTSRQDEKLVLAVQLTKSKLPACAIGNKGSLIVTQTSLVLNVCSRSYDGGRTSAHLIVT